jgi:multiple sugar transport system permease protein
MKKRWISTGLLLLIGVVFVYPFLWMLFSAFKSNQEIFRPLQLLPKIFDPGYFRTLFFGDRIPFYSAYSNSLFIALVQALGAVVVSSMAGFVLARYRFPGRQVLFLAAILVILIPRQVLALPLTGWLVKLNLNDSLWGVILPGMVSGLGIIFFREIFRKVPREYLEIARLEGASEFRVYRTLLPLVASALLAYGLIHFILAWHEHLIPLMVLDSESNLTLPLVLNRINDPVTHTPKALVMAASSLIILPTALLFALLYRHFKSALADLLVH